ncbi:hypothetical protein JCM19233_1228 [Vibrio astriarenae]|nr:hypothetical protein JCM19233_1228 [Vibrio sp. C7]
MPATYRCSIDFEWIGTELLPLGISNRLAQVINLATAMN